MIPLKPRVGSRWFRLRRETLHTVNLCKRTEYVDAIRYLQSLCSEDRCEVYGRTLVMLLDTQPYHVYRDFRTEVWSSPLVTSHVKEE